MPKVSAQTSQGNLPAPDPPVMKRASVGPPPMRRPVDEQMQKRLQEVHDMVIAVHDEDHQRLEEVTRGAGGRGRRAIHHEGMLQKLSTSEQGSERCVQAWLFDDVLMYARPLPGSGKFQLLRWVPLLDCKVSSTEAGGKRGGGGFSLTVEGKKGMCFVAKDQADREDWVHEIRECIAEATRAHYYYSQHPELLHQQEGANDAFDSQIAEMAGRHQAAGGMEEEGDKAAAVDAAAAALERAYEDPHLTLQERYDKLLGLLKEEARQRAEAERSSLGLREQLESVRKTLKDTRAVMAGMEEEVRRERGAADKARNELKAAITAHETRLEEEEQKRVKLENLLRKERAINEVSKQQRLGELHEMRRLEETVEAVRDEKAELRQILDNCIQENEALLRESRTLHQALGVSKQMVAAEETASIDQQAKMASMEKRMLGLYEKVAERDKQLQALAHRCSVLEKDLDRAQVLLLTRSSASHAPASFRQTSIQRGAADAAGGGARRWPAHSLKDAAAAAAGAGAGPGHKRKDSWGQEESARRIILLEQQQQSWARGGGVDLAALPLPGLKDSVRHYHSPSNNRLPPAGKHHKHARPPALDGPSLSRLEEMADSVRQANHLLRPSNKGLMQQQEGVRLTDLYGHRELEPPKIR